MPRPRPELKPIDQTPTPEELCEDGVLSLPRAARFCSVKVDTIRGYLKQREFPSFMLGNKLVIPRISLVKWLGKVGEVPGQSR